MRVLCVGDVVGEAGLAYFCETAPRLKRELAADFVIVNGENSDKSGLGLTSHGAQALLQHADVVTGGNHSYRRTGEELYLENPALLHPANQPYTEDGAGRALVDTGRLGTVRVVNLAGVAWMEPLDNPFKRIDELLAQGEARYTIVDFHAESTAEKKALAFYLDGRVSAVFGTHTHVQTADEQVLPQGTGFITDAGMCGPAVSVIGFRPENAIQWQKKHVHTHFEVAQGTIRLDGVLFDLCDESGLCLSAQRIARRSDEY